MLQIYFHPESDKNEFIEGAKQYQQIWNSKGKEIVQILEQLSGLTFKTTFIHAVVFKGIDYSYPLRLHHAYPIKIKIAELTHELCHRLLVDNNLNFGVLKNQNNQYIEEVHKFIYLILFDAWIKIIDRETAEMAKETELSHNHPSYIRAWKWALSFKTKEDRLKQYRILLEKYKG
jgi:hypothetical protein